MDIRFKDGHIIIYEWWWMWKPSADNDKYKIAISINLLQIIGNILKEN